ncbi:aldolase [Janthinobacterium sp.]|uniref:aldolase n=1 Tax=Janthinobacterium sp. TaxID=1871054 RepID=UPI0025845922|nr:aldolase [Janthinobacterium sp.]MCX7293661.1 aldolase [Janthinobacterium sp.]
MDQVREYSKAELMTCAQEEMQKQFQADRWSLREKVALTCRILFSQGHESGLAGQITTRIDDSSHFLTQRLGLGFDEITPSNLLEVTENLELVSGDGMPNPANRFHSWIYRARPEVRCIVHTHPLHTSALSMLELPLAISHMDTALLFDDVAFLPDWPGVPVGNEEGRIISEAIGDKRALLLAHHGLVVACPTVEEACVIAIQFERAAKLHLLASSAGKIRPISPALAREAHDWVLTASRSRATFAYYARRILRDLAVFE